MFSLNFTEEAIFVALRAALLSMPDLGGVEVIRTQVNRVPEPKAADFVLMTPILRERLATNIDNATDTIITGAISGTTLTVLTVQRGIVRLGARLTGNGVPDGTMLLERLPIGTYRLSTSAELSARTMYAGMKAAMQETKLTIQLDIHGPASADNAQIISTLLWDEFIIQPFAGIDAKVLYSSDPRQVPFIDAESQWENRWSVDVLLQANQIVYVPQEFADVLTPTLVEVEAIYPVE